MLQIIGTSDKELKKKQKKEETSRKQAENAKIRDVLIIFETMKLMKGAEARDHFLNGSNGACKLDESDFIVFDKLYVF